MSNTIKAGAIAGLFLSIIYGMLTYLGAVSKTRFGVTEMELKCYKCCILPIWRKNSIIRIIFSSACLTTSVGLLTSCSQYFAKLIPKISYKTFVKILSVSSMIFANVGLTQILKFSVPVLTAIYPMAIVLMVLALLNKFLRKLLCIFICYDMYFFCQYLRCYGAIWSKVNILNSLPFYSKGLGWIIPAVVGAIAGFIYGNLGNKVAEQKYMLESK